MSKALTPRQRRNLLAYLAEAQEAMALTHWHLEVPRRWARKSLEANAAIWIADEAHAASIRVARNFLDLSRTQQRQVICHELCHLIMEPVSQAIDRNSTPRGGDNHANDNLHPIMEIAVDDFAWLIAERLPLPPRGWLD